MSVFWREILSSSGRLRSLESGKKGATIRSATARVNFLMCMLKYLVFLKTRMVDNVIQARALIKMQVLQVARILNLPVVDPPDLFPAIQTKLRRLSSKLYNHNTFRTADTHLKFCKDPVKTQNRNKQPV